jgi:hypothetical protein
MTKRARRKIDATLKAKIAPENREREIKRLHAKIRQLIVERDFLAKSSGR